MNKLITASLFNGIDWYRNCPESWRKKAFSDLKNQLSRIWVEPNEAIRRGMEFENTIYKILQLGKENKVNCSDIFKKFLVECKGGIFQKKTKMIIEVDGVEYLLFGKMDCWFPDLIIDIKTTSKEWDDWSKKKYLESMQHVIYCYTEGISSFKYLIGLFNDGKLIEMKSLGFNAVSQDALKKQIIDKIKEMVLFFEEHEELKILYHTKFCRN